MEILHVILIMKDEDFSISTAIMLCMKATSCLVFFLILVPSFFSFFSPLLCDSMGNTVMWCCLVIKPCLRLLNRWFQYCPFIWKFGSDSIFRSSVKLGHKVSVLVELQRVLKGGLWIMLLIKTHHYKSLLGSFLNLSIVTGITYHTRHWWGWPWSSLGGRTCSPCWTREVPW